LKSSKGNGKFIFVVGFKQGKFSFILVTAIKQRRACTPSF
jgi:hypothetical protein